MRLIQLLTNELLDRILVFTRCATNKKAFLNSCKQTRQLYISSSEVERAFRTKRTIDGAVQMFHGCFNGPCGPGMARFNTPDHQCPLPHRHYRSQCCLHPKQLKEVKQRHDPPYLLKTGGVEGSIFYQCCSSKCQMILDHDVRTTHTTAFWRKSHVNWNVNRQCRGCGEPVPPSLFVTSNCGLLYFQHTNNSSAPTTTRYAHIPIDTLDWMIVSHPHHIGVETKDIPEHRLQTYYDESYDYNINQPNA